MWTRAALLGIGLVLGAGCHSTGLTSPTGDHVERVPFDGYTIPGVRLFRVTVVRICNDCDSPSHIEGIDEHGNALAGADLFRRCRGLPPLELARRALDLLSMSGGSGPLGPATGTRCFEDAASCALMAPPAVERDILTFWVNYGSMHPTLTRVRVNLTTAAVEAKTASEIAHPPQDPAPTPPEVVGAWEGSMAGGPGATRKDVYAADGQYAMDGYPSIAERATYAIVSRHGNVVEVRMTHRRTCGPCDSPGPQQAQPDEVRSIELAADGQSMRFGGWTLQRAAAPR